MHSSKIFDYHHALLLASILRHQGITVRLRAGFARYYEKEAKVRFGHVVCEVLDSDNQEWILIDPDRNIIDVKRERFEAPSQAWQHFYNTDYRSIRYVSSTGEGFQALIHALLMDHSFVIVNERNYWHTPTFVYRKDFNLNDLKADQIQLIEKIAESMNEPDNKLSELQILYDNNPFIHSHERSLMNYYEKNED